MGLIIDLGGSLPESSTLPTLEEVGYIPTDGLMGLWDFSGESTYLDDKSGGGWEITLGTGWSWENGILTASSGDGLWSSDLLRGSAAAGGNVFTGICVHKSAKDGISRLFTSGGNRGIHGNRQQRQAVPAHAGSGGGGFYQYPGPQAPDKAYNDWVMYNYACDGTNIYASADDLAWGSGTEINAGGIYPLTSGSTVGLGSGNSGQETRGDFGLWAYWDRKLTDNELKAVYNAAKRIMKSKGVDSL